MFDAVVRYVKSIHESNRRVIIAAWTLGARERLSTLLSEHGLKAQAKIEGFTDALAQTAGVTSLAVLGLEQGFETPELVVIAEQDILGDRLVTPAPQGP